MEDQQHYIIGKYDVFFVPWYSEYMDEDFIAVYVKLGDHEVMHSGMTKHKPSIVQAEKIVKLLEVLNDVSFGGIE